MPKQKEETMDGSLSNKGTNSIMHIPDQGEVKELAKLKSTASSFELSGLAWVYYCGVDGIVRKQNIKTGNVELYPWPTDGFKCIGHHMKLIRTKRDKMC